MLMIFALEIIMSVHPAYILVLQYDDHTSVSHAQVKKKTNSSSFPRSGPIAGATIRQIGAA